LSDSLKNRVISSANTRSLRMMFSFIRECYALRRELAVRRIWPCWPLAPREPAQRVPQAAHRIQLSSVPDPDVLPVRLEKRHPREHAPQIDPRAVPGSPLITITSYSG
jgi:hypothetical protein